MAGPSCTPGSWYSKGGVKITFPSGLVLRVRDIFKSYKPNPNDNRSNYQTDKSGDDIITVYPNPADGIVNVRMPEDRMVQSVQVIDRLGKVVIHQKIQSHDFSIPVGDLVPGMYILRLTDGSSITSRRFMKQ